MFPLFIVPFISRHANANLNVKVTFDGQTSGAAMASKRRSTVAVTASRTSGSKFCTSLNSVTNKRKGRTVQKPCTTCLEVARTFPKIR